MVLVYACLYITSLYSKSISLPVCKIVHLHCFSNDSFSLFLLSIEYFHYYIYFCSYRFHLDIPDLCFLFPVVFTFLFSLYFFLPARHSFFFLPFYNPSPFFQSIFLSFRPVFLFLQSPFTFSSMHYCPPAWHLHSCLASSSSRSRERCLGLTTAPPRNSWPEM